MSQSRNKKTPRNYKPLSFAATSALMLSTAVYPLSQPWTAQADTPLLESSPIADANPLSAESVKTSDVTFIDKQSVIDSIPSWKLKFTPHLAHDGYIGAGSHDYVDMTMTVSLPYDANLHKGSAFILDVAPGYMFVTPRGGFSIHQGDNKNTSVARIVTSDDKGVKLFGDKSPYASDKNAAGARVRVGFVLDKDFVQQPGVVNNITFTIPVIADPTFTAPVTTPKKLYVTSTFKSVDDTQSFYTSSLKDQKSSTITTSYDVFALDAPSLNIKSYGSNPVDKSQPIPGRHGFMSSASDIAGADSFVSSRFIYDQAYFVRSDTPAAFATDGFAAVYSPGAEHPVVITPGKDGKAFDFASTYAVLHDASGLLGSGDMFGVSGLTTKATTVSASSSGELVSNSDGLSISPQHPSLAFVYGLGLDKSFASDTKSIDFAYNGKSLNKTTDGLYNVGNYTSVPVLLASGVGTKENYQPHLNVNFKFDESGSRKEQKTASAPVIFGLSEISLTNNSSQFVDGAIDIDVNGHEYRLADSNIHLGPSEVKTLSHDDPRFTSLFERINADLRFTRPGTYPITVTAKLTYNKDNHKDFNHTSYAVVAAPGKLATLTLSDMLPANPYGVSYLPIITGQDKQGRLSSDFSLRSFAGNPILTQLSEDYKKPISCSHSDRAASSSVFAIANDCSVHYGIDFNDDIRGLPNDISSSVRLDARFDDNSTYNALRVPGLAQFDLNYFDNTSNVEADADSPLQYDSGKIIRIHPQADVKYLGASADDVSRHLPVVNYSIENQDDVPWAKVAANGDLILDTHFKNDTSYNDDLVKKSHVIKIAAEIVTTVSDSAGNNYTVATTRTVIPVEVKINARDKDKYPLPSFGTTSQYFVPSFVENNSLSASFVTPAIQKAEGATLSLDPSVPSWISLVDGDKLSINATNVNYHSNEFIAKVYDYANNGVPMIATYGDGSVQKFNSPLIILTGFSQRNENFTSSVPDVVHVKQKPATPAQLFVGYSDFNTIASVASIPVDYRVRYALAPSAPKWASLTQVGIQAPVNVATVKVNPSMSVEPGKYLIPVVVTAVDNPYTQGRAATSSPHASTIVNVPVIVDKSTNYAGDYTPSVADVTTNPGKEISVNISGLTDLSKVAKINFKNDSYVVSSDTAKGSINIRVPLDAPSPSTQNTSIEVVYTDGTKDTYVPVSISVTNEDVNKRPLADVYRDFYLGNKDFFVDEVLSSKDKPSIADFSADSSKAIKTEDVAEKATNKYFSSRLNRDLASLATKSDISENLNNLVVGIDPAVKLSPGSYDIKSDVVFSDGSEFKAKDVGVFNLFALPYEGQPNVISMKQTDSPKVIPAPAQLPFGSACSGLSTNPSYVTVSSDCSVTIAPTRSNSDPEKDRSFGVRISRPGLRDRVFTFGLHLTKVTDADLFESRNGGVRPSSISVTQTDTEDFSKIEGLDQGDHVFKVKNSSQAPGVDLSFLKVNKEGVVTASPSAKSKPGTYPFVLEVHFADDSVSHIELKAKVLKLSDNKAYSPQFSSPVLEVVQGRTNTSSQLDLPEGASCKLQDKSRIWASLTSDCALKVSPTIENSSTGDFSVNVVVTYADGSSSVVNEIVRVTPGKISYVAANNDFSVKAGSTKIFSTDHPDSIARCDILEGPTDFISVDKTTCDLTVSPRLDTPKDDFNVRVAAQTKNGTRLEIVQKITVTKADDSASFTSGYPSASNQKPVPQGKDTVLIPPRNIPVGTACSLGDNAPYYAKVNPQTCVVTLSPGYKDAPGTYGVSVVYTFEDGSVKYLTAPYKVVEGAISGRVEPIYSQDNKVVQGESLTVPIPTGLSDVDNVVFTKGGTEPQWVSVSRDGSLVITPSIDTKPDHYDVPVVVTYADSTFDSVKVGVDVTATTESARHNPSYNNPVMVRQGDTTFEPLIDSDGVVSVNTTKDTPEFVKVNPKTGALTVDPGWDISGPFDLSVIVSYKDGSKRKVSTTVVVNRAPLAERYDDPYGLKDPTILGKPLASVVQKQTAIVNPITNLPEGTHCVLSEGTPSWVTIDSNNPCSLRVSPSLNTASNRTYNVGVTIIYPDTSAVKNDVNIYVQKLADSDVYRPSARPVTVNAGESASTMIVGIPSGSIISGDNLPKWVTINGSGLVVFSPGYEVIAKSGELTFTITYPDGTWNNVAVPLTIVKTPMAEKFSPKYRLLDKNVRVNSETRISTPTEVPSGIKAFACDDTPDWAKVNLDGSVIVNPTTTTPSGEHFIPVCIIYSDDTKEKSGFRINVLNGLSTPTTSSPQAGNGNSTQPTNIAVGGNDLNGVSVVNMLNERRRLQDILGKPGSSHTGSLGTTSDTKTLRPLEGSIFGPPVVKDPKVQATINPQTNVTQLQNPTPAPVAADGLSPTTAQPNILDSVQTGVDRPLVVGGAQTNTTASSHIRPQQGSTNIMDTINDILGGNKDGKPAQPAATVPAQGKGVVTGEGVKQQNTVEVILAVMLIVISAGVGLFMSYRKKD